jgi:predicted RNA-binding protein with PIN domain
VGVPVVIDGYNLLYARGEEPSAGSRARLVHDLIRWADRRQRRVVLVFDAWAQGQRVEREETHGPVTVCFTRYGERADEWIVRRVATRPEVVVVTSDRAVAQSARRRGAAVLGAAAFAARLDGTATADEADAADADADADRDRRAPPPGRRLGRRASWLRGL